VPWRPSRARCRHQPACRIAPVVPPRTTPPGLLHNSITWLNASQLAHDTLAHIHQSALYLSTDSPSRTLPRRPRAISPQSHARTSTPSIMASSASKRLFKEYKALSSDPPEGIAAGPMSEDDMFLWEALIQGPEGTPFEGGIFPAELKFPKDYPLAPPKMKFMTDVWHPNGTSLA
jgi:hypothetical protein